MTDSRRSLGQRAEDWIAAQLHQAGYTILDRNWRYGKMGELDIVARYGPAVIFVEVRARSGSLDEATEAALESVNARKCTRLIHMAEAYLAAHNLDDCPRRITVVAVAAQNGVLAMEIIKNAVEW